TQRIELDGGEEERLGGGPLEPAPPGALENQAVFGGAHMLEAYPGVERQRDLCLQRRDQSARTGRDSPADQAMALRYRVGRQERCHPAPVAFREAAHGVAEPLCCERMGRRVTGAPARVEFVVGGVEVCLVEEHRRRASAGGVDFEDLEVV